MFKRKLVALGVVCSMFLTGCANEEISTLNSIQSLGSSSERDDVNLGLSERQELVYAQVSERSLLNLTELGSCTESEVQQVLTYMDMVDKQLTGEVSSSDGVIDENLTNYLLWEFEKTPYYWQRLQTAIYGIDKKSRSIVVDVTYNTIGFSKEVQEDSYLVRGEPEYTKKAKVRYDRWMALLRNKYNYNTQIDWTKDWADFEKVYGKAEDIFESQRNEKLTSYLYETGNQKTYNGLVNSDGGKEGGTMIVRYVLVPRYVLGVNMGMDCKHMYVMDYILSNDLTESLSLFRDDGYATISDNVYSVLDSYFKAIDESDMSGLYKLTDNFAAWDKYYMDMRECSYTKNGEFTVSLFDIQGTEITCGVQISSKIRAKGSNMTMPLYTDRYFVKLKLMDEQLKVTGMTLLSRKIEGEPLIEEGENDISGFNEEIDLSASDRTAIEELICSLGTKQLAGALQDDYADVLDLSMSSIRLKAVMGDIQTVVGGTKAVFIETYQQGTGNYASVKCRELHQKDTGEVIESEVVYEFISKGGKWYVYGYDTLSSVSLGQTEFHSEGAVAVLKPNTVESYYTQVSHSTVGDEGSEEVSGTTEVKAVVISHEIVNPALKNGKKANVVMNASTITDQQFESLWSGLSDGLSIDTMKAFDESIQLASGVDGSMIGEAKKLVCLSHNKAEGIYSSEEFNTAWGTFVNGYNSYNAIWSERGDAEVVQAFANVVKKVK